jgi:Zn-dependent metalloprotease
VSEEDIAMAKSKRPKTKAAGKRAAKQRSPAKKRAKAARRASPGRAGFEKMALHAFDKKDGRAVAQLKRERSTSERRFAAAASARPRALDPETVAKQFLDDAVESTATPQLTKPKLGAATTEYKSLGTETVPLTGTTTVKFRQCIDKIPVYGSLVTIELGERNELISINSAIGAPKGVNALAKISPADAVKAVEEHAGCRKKLEGVVPRLNFYFEQAKRKWRLVFILEDVPTRPERAPNKKRKPTPHFTDFVVDAHSGAVVAALPRTPAAAKARTITALDARGKKRKIRVRTRSSKQVLSDPVLNVHTFDFGLGDPSENEDALPGVAVGKPPKWSPSAVSAHANAAAVVEFMRDALKRNNVDGKGGAVNSSINCVVVDEVEDGAPPDEWVNAFWNGAQMVYGQRHINGRVASVCEWLDVVAHEIFHGVTDETARLEYLFESGALNESYSDIFGVIVANAHEPDTLKWDWRIGDGLDDGGRPWRNMAKPHLRDQPSHMRYYYDTDRSDDEGGVHTNSGIHNKAAYNMLVARKNGKAVLTPTEVMSIFYVALTQQLTRTSGFSDSRRAVVVAARSLFRKLPEAQSQAKIKAVETAFTAVGIK